MEIKKTEKLKEKKLSTYLSLDYTIGLVLTIISIIIGYITRNDFFYKFGIIFLIATPVAGIFISIIYNSGRKNLKNVLISIAVFLILTASALIGLFGFK